MQENFALLRLGEFLERHEEMAVVPALRLGPVGDRVERDEEAALEAAGARRLQLADVSPVFGSCQRSPAAVP